MYDIHYDLLTILYFNFLKNNDKGNINKTLNLCKKIYNENNIIGGIINLYFMSENEMLEELGIDEYPYDVIKMFSRSIKILNQLKKEKIINPNTDFLYSIEGCDYIKDDKELSTLYNLGLRSIILVWNNENKYGSGNRSDKGLTNLGKSFIKKAVELGIIIDLSHANEKTFDDMIELLKKGNFNSKNPIIIASHSNCKTLCDRKRNLTDEQLIKLRDIGGYIGLFSNRNFVSLNTDNETIQDRKAKYLEHIDHILKLGFSEDKILLSTDDMNFNSDESYHGLETFNLENINFELRDILKTRYDNKFIDKIMYKNAKKLFNMIK